MYFTEVIACNQLRKNRAKESRCSHKFEPRMKVNTVHTCNVCDQYMYLENKFSCHQVVQHVNLSFDIDPVVTPHPIHFSLI